MRFNRSGIGEPLTPEQIETCRTMVDDAVAVVAGMVGTDATVGENTNRPMTRGYGASRPNPLTTNVIRRHGRPRSHVKPITSVPALEL